MKIVSILAVVSLLALGACNQATGTAEAAKADPVAKVKLPDAHAVQILGAFCAEKSDCTVSATFRLKEYSGPEYGVRSFSFSCKKGSTMCSCYGNNFCSKDIVLQKDGKQYQGTVLDVNTNDRIADIELKGVRDVANLLVGEGKIYASNEPVPTLPGATMVVK